MKSIFVMGLLFFVSCGNNEVGRFVPAGGSSSHLVDTKKGDICIPVTVYDIRKKRTDSADLSDYKRCGD